MSAITPHNCYVYRHIRLDKNVPFYIGVGTIGKKDNGAFFRAYAKNHRSRHWHNVVNKTSIEVEIILTDLTQQEAFKKEKEFIALYGRQDNNTGCLVNLTDGGDGHVGYQPSKESVEKMRESKKGSRLSEEHKEKLSKSLMGRKFSEESIRRMSEAQKKWKRAKGRIQTSSTRQKISQTLLSKRIVMPEEAKQKLSLAKRGSVLKGNAEIEVYKDGVLVATYRNARAASLALGCFAQNISKVLKGERNAVNGFTFKKASQCPT